jgi:hypothetical protein
VTSRTVTAPSPPLVTMMFPVRLDALGSSRGTGFGRSPMPDPDGCRRCGLEAASRPAANRELCSPASIRIAPRPAAPYLEGGLWTAREWDLFSRRRVFNRSMDETTASTPAIVPVIWTPVRRLPPMIVEADLFMPTGLPPEFSALYREDGLLGLLKTGRDNTYQAIVWKLALHVEKIRSTYWVEPLVISNAESLATSFH